ncbi:MAG TPA: glycosyltransferase family 1 protein, partial [Arcobacter sp.]|nr:glycosyltransferase family 1 protein [Arcobacter sp.]
MKVIHILNELKYSGAEIMYVDAASLFQYKGCQLAVVSTAKNVGEFAPKFQEAGYEVF